MLLTLPILICFRPSFGFNHPLATPIPRLIFPFTIFPVLLFRVSHTPPRHTRASLRSIRNLSYQWLSFPLHLHLLGKKFRILGVPSGHNSCPSTCFRLHFVAIFDSSHLLRHRTRLPLSCSCDCPSLPVSSPNTPFRAAVASHLSLTFLVQAPPAFHFNFPGRPATSSVTSLLGTVSSAPAAPSYILPFV